ncbi:MAG: bifunctional oligoribonuclease/PAP phosphatase NrnA [Tannerella sp.]|jgi:phosphoesterase RecJ-like protein|nr:bifunctional oligoribonuclease/PAP phosphatase NrnA [Tannerella sp.]
MLTKYFEDKDVHKLETYIRRGERFVIITHITPDGDAIGSSLGLHHYLSYLGKDSVNVVVPNDFPAFLKWMPGANDIVIYESHKEYAERLIREADVIFCLDFNELRRIGKLAPFLEAADGRKVLIDHHPDISNFCRLILSCPEMSSTSEMVFRLLCAIKSFSEINKDAAECIYAGMMTDTGSFTFGSNNPELYYIITELVKKGIDKDKIYRNVYQVYSESRLRLMGYTFLEKMKVYPEHKTALITLTLKELNRFNYKTGDTEGFVNMLLSIEGVQFAVFIREDTDQIKLSFRSTGDFPTNRFASQYFQGGGHTNASGGEFYGSLAGAVQAFEAALPAMYPTGSSNFTHKHG